MSELVCRLGPVLQCLHNRLCNSSLSLVLPKAVSWIVTLLGNGTERAGSMLSAGLFCPAALCFAVWRMWLANKIVFCHGIYQISSQELHFGLLSSELLPSPLLSSTFAGGDKFSPLSLNILLLFREYHNMIDNFNGQPKRREYRR